MAFGEIFAGHSGKFRPGKLAPSCPFARVANDSAGFGSSCPLASHIINVCIVWFLRAQMSHFTLIVALFTKLHIRILANLILRVTLS